MLTASERLAHAVRRHICLELDRADLLAGVALQRPLELARRILLAAGEARLSGWSAVRRLRLISLFHAGAFDRQLRYFNPLQLQSSLGYARAFADTLRDLEFAGLDPRRTLAVARSLESAEPAGADRLLDVATVWSRVDQGPRQRWTAAEIFSAAAAAVTAEPSLADGIGSVYALLTGSPSTVLLRFLTALPNGTLVLQEGRPWRTGAQRWRAGLALVEPEEREPAEADPWQWREIDLLRRYLFELPEVLTEPERPRSQGPDGTVSIEEYASIEEEIETAAVWVAGQIEAGVPLERIAVVVPDLGAYAVPLVDRLQRIGGAGTDGIAVHVAGGIPLAATGAGVRLRAVLQALAQSLEASAVIRLLPLLRRPGQSSETPNLRLSPSRAAAIVYGAGIVGGTPRDPEGVGEWMPRLSRQCERMRARAEAAEAALAAGINDRLEQRRCKMKADDSRQWLREVEPLLPVVARLQDLGQAVQANAGFDVLWRQLAELCEQHLVLPPDPPAAVSLLRGQLASILDDNLASQIRGRTAISYLQSVLEEIPVSSIRFGAPAVFVGTPAQAAGLPFSAVRLLGLAEGGMPHTPHDDPILPDDLRRQLEAAAQLEVPDILVPRLADRVLDEIHDTFRAVQGAAERVAFSVPRQWTDRSERELSGIVLEVATALGRRRNGDDSGDVPTAARLHAAYFAVDVDRQRRLSFRARATPRALLTSIAAGEREGAGVIRVPLSWAQRPALAIGRLRELATVSESGELEPIDGALRQAWSLIPTPGIDGRPISASALGLLLGCPYRYLLERVLHHREPYRRPPTDTIEAGRYGELFHRIAEQIYGEIGPRLCRQEGELETHLGLARTIAEAELDRFCETYPLRGADTLDRERARLSRQIEQLVRDEWQRPPRQFVASEQPFGEVGGVPLPAGDSPLHVWGEIDRIDRLAEGFSLRDLKTGRIHDGDEDRLSAGRDLQLGIYLLALESREEIAGAGAVVEAAYVHPAVLQDSERLFRGARLDSLRKHARGWLRVAGSLLRSGNFVRTVTADDCRMCPFQPACGDEPRLRSTAKLEALPQTHALEPFRRMKKYEADE